MGNARIIRRRLGRLALKRIDQPVGLRMAILLGLCRQGQGNLVVPLLHGRFGLAVKRLAHSNPCLIARGLRRGTVTDKLKRLLILLSR